jgi:16S rRNA (cytosine1402-N4)-methyltransferase
LMERHRPVMPEEVLELLSPGRGGVIVDGTLGMGGHSGLILQHAPEARVLGLDRDAESLELARERLVPFGDRFEGIHADYRQIARICAERGLERVAGILVDLGISSWQLDTADRGFSFRAGESREAGAPLDMRMDRSKGSTAADLVNRLSERELADLIYEFGEERAARRIARQLVVERSIEPIKTTERLAALVIRAVNQRGYWKIHPATKTFQALRIAVNRELDGLEEFVANAVDLLEPGGRLVVISFHSLEDRLIKQALRYQSGRCSCPASLPRCECGAVARVAILTRKAMLPRDEEIADNPRARSAKLRACQKLEQVQFLVDRLAVDQLAVDQLAGKEEGSDEQCEKLSSED